MHTDLLALGFSDLVSEPCVYTMRGPSGELRGIAIAYVDDVMISFKPGDDLMEKQFVNVQALYEWGLWEAGDFKQTVGRVMQKYDSKTGRWGEIHLDYVEKVQPVHIAANRRKVTSPLTPAEQTQLLEANGKLTWVAQQIIPLLCAPLSYLMADMKAGTIASCSRRTS